jgi:hypothetical protein
VQRLKALKIGGDHELVNDGLEFVEHLKLCNLAAHASWTSDWVLRIATEYSGTRQKKYSENLSLHFKKMGGYDSARIGISYCVPGINVPDGILWSHSSQRDRFNVHAFRAA